MKHPKHIFLRCILALLLLVLAGTSPVSRGLRAQDTIGFSGIGFTGMPDTVTNGNSTLVGAFIKNFSPSTIFNDSVQIVGYIDTSSIVSFQFPPYDSILMNPGDTAFVIMPVSFSDPTFGGRFRIGSNTIVIWPVALHSSFATGDSLTATIFILPTGIAPEPRNEVEVRCFPVPASGPLFIMSQNPRLQPVNAIVRDLNGKVIAESKNLANGIDTEPWPAGIYFIEVTFDNGSRGVYKVSRQ